MISTNNIEQAKKLIKSEKKPIIVNAQDEEFNRKILEHGKFSILAFRLEDIIKQKDSIKNVHSGINHVLANIAGKNDIAFGYDFSSFQNLKRKEKAIALSKLRQNIKICRKSKAKLKILNYKDKNGVQALLFSLGASSQQAKQAISF